MNEKTKNALNDVLEYVKKYKAKKLAFAFALMGGAVAFPPTIPFIVAAGAAIAYVDYKKKNPKATAKHFAENAIKSQRNQDKLWLQATNIGQAFMYVRKRIQERKDNSSEGKVLHEHKRSRNIEEKSLNIQSTPVLSDDAEKARRLNHIRMVNIRKEREKGQKIHTVSEYKTNISQKIIDAARENSK